jgi:glycosyltransferase involved in cell wall biosynthesis
MRLIMLNNEFPPLGGGTGVVNHQILVEFAKRGDVRVDLVTSARGRGPLETRQFSERIRIFAVPVDNRNLHHATNAELIRYAWYSYQLSRKLIQAAQYDASFAFAGVPAGAVSWALKRTANLPYLVSLHGADVPGFEARYAYLYPALKPLVRRIWQEAAVVTSISPAHRQLAHATLAGLPIRVIPNGVDTDVFHPRAEPRDRGRLEFVCVGRLIERKGQHHLLRAFARLQASGMPAHLRLIGVGDAERALRRLADELNLSRDVTFAGPLAHAQVAEAYRQADVFVLPSQNEGMSVAVLEAMASGLPVIVTPTAGAPGLVSDGVEGRIVPWADVPALAAALRQLAHDPAGRLRLGAAARQAALHYNWSAIAQEYLDACSQVVDQTAATSARAPHMSPLPSVAPE